MNEIFSFFSSIGLGLAFILFSGTVFTGVVVLVDCIWQRKLIKAGEDNRKTTPVLIDYCRSLFPVFLIVVVLRSFVVQPYVVPTGSLEPTIMPGDFIFVEQFAYGIKLPIWNKTIIPIGELHRGDIALFHYPVNPNLNFIKRVIGLPGDKISYHNKQLTINGKKVTETFLKDTTANEPGFGPYKVKIYKENLLGLQHEIQISNDKRLNSIDNKPDFTNLIVPQGEYFMMGDNRDNSEDSRYWGFVPKKDFIGKAKFVFLHMKPNGHWFSGHFPFFLVDKVGWDRIGKGL